MKCQTRNFEDLLLNFVLHIHCALETKVNVVKPSFLLYRNVEKYNKNQLYVNYDPCSPCFQPSGSRFKGNHYNSHEILARTPIFFTMIITKDNLLSVFENKHFYHFLENRANIKILLKLWMKVILQIFDFWQKQTLWQMWYT